MRSNCCARRRFGFGPRRIYGYYGEDCLLREALKIFDCRRRPASLRNWEGRCPTSEYVKPSAGRPLCRFSRMRKTFWINYFRSGRRQVAGAARERSGRHASLSRRGVGAWLASSPVANSGEARRDAAGASGQSQWHPSDDRGAASLYSKGIGLTDAHLVASCLITPGTFLWTTMRYEAWRQRVNRCRHALIICL